MFGSSESGPEEEVELLKQIFFADLPSKYCSLSLRCNLVQVKFNDGFFWGVTRYYCLNLIFKGYILFSMQNLSYLPESNGVT